MTPKQFERMAKCDHRKTCGRLVTLKASSYADPYHWCLCGECPYYSTENTKLRELLQRLLTEYRYMRVRPRRVYLQHEGRMRAIEEEMRELGVEVQG